MNSSCPPSPVPLAIPGTFAIEELPGPVTRVNSFPNVNFLAPIGQAVTCDMRGATTSVTPDGNGGWTILGEVDIGGVVMSQADLEALPGYTEFFPALLQAGLAKLNPPPPEE
jgi:hypothetical protein